MGSGTRVFEGTPEFQRYASSGLDILVVGGGIAGLSFAIEAFRKGHEVRVLDRRPDFNDYGDLIAIQESGVQTPKAWPEFLDRCHEAPVPKVGRVYKHDGTYLGGTTSFALATTRSLFHSMLHQYVQHLGISVRHSARVMEYFEEDDHAGVVLENEEKLLGNIVVAADGIGSRSWGLVSGYKEEPISSGFAIFRATFPVERAMANPLVAEAFSDPESGSRIMFGPGAHMVTAKTDEHMMFMLTHKDNSDSEEDWAKTTHPVKALPYIEGWAPWVSEMIKSAPEDGAVDFKLMWRNPREKWYSPKARVIQIGDAAHTFLPTSASGATMAMEDAFSLATCLQISGKSNAPLAVRVHNKLRFERVTCAQKMGFKTREKLHNADPDILERDASSLLSSNLVGSWVTRHDPEQYAYEMYDKCANHILNNTPFKNTNSVPGHTFAPWTVQEMLDIAERHETINDDGDWS